MFNRNKIRELENRKLTIIRNIKIAQESKQKITRFADYLNIKYSTGEINYDEYAKLINNTLKDKTLEDWVNYYDNYIINQQSFLALCIKQIEIEENKKADFSKYLLVSLIFLVLGIGLFSLGSGLTGLTIYEPSSIIDENITIYVNTPVSVSSRLELEFNAQNSTKNITDILSNESLIKVDNLTFYNITYLEFNTKLFRIAAPSDLGNYSILARIIDNDLVLGENITQITVSELKNVTNQTQVVNEVIPVNFTDVRVILGSIINLTVEIGLPQPNNYKLANVTASLNKQKSTLPLSEFTINNKASIVDVAKFNLIAEDGIINIKIIRNNIVLNETNIQLDILNNVKSPARPEIMPRKIKTIDEVFNKTPFIDVSKDEVREIKEIGFAGKEITLEGKEKKTLIIHQPIFDKGSFDQEVPLIQKDNFTYSTTFEDTTIEIEFDSREIKNNKTGKNFMQDKNAGSSAWKINYSYLLPSEKFKAKLRVSSSSPITVFDYYYGMLESGKFNIDFTAERENGYEIEVVDVSENIVYMYLSKDFAKEGKSVNDAIILDPTLTIDATTTTLCAEITAYDKIEVINRGVLAICARTNATTGYANITLGDGGNFSLFANSNIEGAGSGARGGASSSSATACSTQGENGNLLVLGTTACTANGGGGGGADRAGTGDSIGGGGAGFGGTGGVGGYSSADIQSTGGATYGSATGIQLLMGSGGGGESGDSTTTPGGPGGGGLKINASTGWINIYGIVNLTGGNGTDGDAQDDSGGGGGSGGHLVLISRNITLNTGGRIYALGASGGNAAGGTNSDSCGGGGGGGGRIHFYHDTLTIGSDFINVSTEGIKGEGTDGACDAGTDAGTSTGGGVGSVAQTKVTFPAPPESDSTSPKWSFPQKNETLVYTTQVINFSTGWTEVEGLSSYVFSINQDGAWVNSSAITFSGTSANSTNITKISAKVSTVVQWYFSANDTSNNWNFTSTQTFVVSNTAPVIIEVNNVTSTAPTITESGTTQFIFNFTAEDLDGTGTLNTATAMGQINRTGEDIRYNLSCLAKQNLSAVRTQFECAVPIYYFDAPDFWTVNATITDTNETAAQNITSNITIRNTLGIAVGPTSLTWPQVVLTSINTTATNNPIVVNNTGNQNVSLGNVRVQALDLAGEITPTILLNASNFTASAITRADKIECLGTRLSNNTVVNIANAGLTKGNNTWNYLNYTSGQVPLYFCLAEVTSGITQQSYSTRGATWTISVV